ncbi:MAG: hypothetical protein B7Z16_08910 [Algoriphagus sp. 32-45-6]|nr:MAG: hypothetical protein B7Z16_08910 [Algoriphagus sp. 32-45-6]
MALPSFVANGLGVIVQSKQLLKAPTPIELISSNIPVPNGISGHFGHAFETLIGLTDQLLTGLSDGDVFEVNRKPYL